MLSSLALLSVLAVAAAQFDPSDVMRDAMPSGDFLDMMARDAEPLPSMPIGNGQHKMMTGGAGEGMQQLRDEAEWKHREQVKSDSVLPAYCEPPNPCPVGYTSEDGCLEQFENTADFSREHQAGQQCVCDHEHMFNCAKEEADDAEAALEKMLAENGLHKKTVAKKFHQKRSSMDMIPRK